MATLRGIRSFSFLATREATIRHPIPDATFRASRSEVPAGTWLRQAEAEPARDTGEPGDGGGARSHPRPAEQTLSLREMHAMNTVTRHRNPNGPAACGLAARNAAWMMAPLAIAATMTPVLLIARADALVLPWLACVLWSLAAGFVQAGDPAVGHDDRTAFTLDPSPCERRSLEEDIDWSTKSGQFAYLRISDSYDMLYNDAHLFSQSTDPTSLFD